MNVGLKMTKIPDECPRCGLASGWLNPNGGHCFGCGFWPEGERYIPDFLIPELVEWLMSEVERPKKLGADYEIGDAHSIGSGWTEDELLSQLTAAIKAFNKREVSNEI